MVTSLSISTVVGSVTLGAGAALLFQRWRARKASSALPDYMHKSMWLQRPKPVAAFDADSRKKEATVASLRVADRTLIIEWFDGHVSTFHNIWLRDNCACELCGDHSGGARVGEIWDMPDDLTLTATHQAGKVLLKWCADGHQSSFSTGWLRAHCNSCKERSKRARKLTSWDASFAGQMPVIDYSKMLRNDHERLRLFDAVRTFGIAQVTNVPFGATEEFAAEISICRETHYGRTFEIHSTPNAAGKVMCVRGP